ncbi:helix-turn-helix domain-containing protein [Actinacidiphila soli]|uniref:helix-turn-helix domain-containing protein n=1 Tax=Actinacidiphila soli TaxID=2487275 RepID=UPI0013E33039|nr:helix-turn-helix domain-containing protein [Actinacidiphila soli]
MLSDLRPTHFRQWFILERFAGKRDYITSTIKDLAAIWEIKERAARDSLKAIKDVGWAAVDPNTGIEHTNRIWLPWYRLSVTADDYDPAYEYDPDGVNAFISKMEAEMANRRTWREERAKERATATLIDSGARSVREKMMTRRGTEFPYIHVPVAVEAALPKGRQGDTDFLVWTALRSFLRSKKIYPSAKTIAEMTGLKRETVARSIKRLVSAGLLLPTGQTEWNGVKVYTVPTELSGRKIRAEQAQAEQAQAEQAQDEQHARNLARLEKFAVVASRRADARREAEEERRRAEERRDAEKKAAQAALTAKLRSQRSQRMEDLEEKEEVEEELEEVAV